MPARPYAKFEPKGWQGATFDLLRPRGPEALLGACYLMTSPHSNMLGLYKQPILYMAYETALGEEGARKALQSCMDVGFCSFDPDTQMVWVHEMARYQVGEELKATDLRCKGIQRAYDALPQNPFLGPFFDHYALAFHLTARRDFGDARQGSLLAPYQAPPVAPSKPRTGTGTGAGDKPSASSAAKLPPCPFDAIVAIYHEVLPELPCVRLMGDPRKQALQRAWKFVLTTSTDDGAPRATTAEEALGWFRDYFTRARANDFLMGRTPRTGEHANWKCDLDFLLTNKGMTHVIEKTE